MPVRIPVTQTGLEASIEAAAKKAGKSLKINMGPGAKSIEGLSQPLGRITGKADEFTKSMEAANARVLAFGASVGVLSAVQRGFADLVRTTIEVEKSLASINSILGTTNKELNTFKGTIFDVARNTEQSFETVANAALELSRQGLKAEEVTKRLNDSLVLSRLSGLGAAEAVAGLTSAINSFNSTGITSAEVLNKLSAAAVSAAVSEKDLIEGIKRSGSVAIQAGVSFDELVGVITAVQERTARGGAVIGNSFKTIFTRIQSLDKLETMQNLGVQVTDASGQVLSATKLIQNLGKTLETLPDAKRLQIAENLVGKFQIAPFLAILEDYNKETSTAIKVTEIAGKATNEAYSRNIALNQTLSAVLNETTINLKELANTLGEIGVTDNLKSILDFFSGIFAKVNELLGGGEETGSTFAKGIVKGIGGVIAGPGLAIFGAIILKLTADLAKFGVGSLKTFFGLNRAAKEQATLQGQIASTLLGNESIQKQILAIENSQLSVADKRKAQVKFFTTALNEQVGIMTRMQSIAATIAPGVMGGTKKLKGRGAGGYIPNFNAVIGYGSEQSDINRGVGGAPKSARPVTIPNFNFGSGQKGTMVANTSEYMVPNFAGTGGSAIFNQDMVSSMGLPAGARRVGAAGGYIPNFAKKPVKTNAAGMIIPRKGVGSRRATGTFGGNTYSFPVFGIDSAGEKVREEKDIKRSVERFSIGLATRESKSMTGGRPTAGKINRLANQGAIGGLAGAIFETALSSLLKSKDFDFGETATFDYVGQSAINSIGDISPALKGSGIKFLDAKIADNSGTRNSMAKKIFSYFGASASGRSISQKGVIELTKASDKGKQEVLSKLGMKASTRGASGYIPNFASPLEDAIGREKAAGLPINQIRINQDPTLRNAGNPMGLAVTNTRDEPTGAIPSASRGFIPNYQGASGANLTLQQIGTRSKKVAANLDELNSKIDSLNKEVAEGTMSYDKASKEVDKFARSLSNNEKTQNATADAAKGQIEDTKKQGKAQRDLLGPIFALQAGLSFLSAATEGAGGAVKKYTNIVSESLSGATSAAFAGVALNDFGKNIKGVGGKFVSKLGIYGAAIGAGISVFKGINEAINEATGKNKAASLAMAALTDATKKLTFNFSNLSAVEQQNLKDEAKAVVGGTVTTRELDLPPVTGARAVDTNAIKNATFKNFQRSRLFEGGKDAESGESFKEMFTKAATSLLSLGVTSEQVDAKLDELGSKASETSEGIFRVKLGQDALNEFLDFLSTTNKKVKKDLDEFTKAISDLSDEDFKNLVKGFRGGNTQDMFRSEAVQAGLGEKGITIPKSQKENIFTLEENKRLADQKKLRVDTARLASNLAKQQIQFAVDLAKADRTVLDQMDQRVLKAELSKSLAEEEMIALKTEQDILNANVGLRDKTLDAVAAMAKASKEITFKENESLELQKLIADASNKESFTKEETKLLIEQTNKLLEESDDRIKEKLQGELNSLKVEEKKTRELTGQLGVLGNIKVKASEIANIRAASDLSFLGGEEERTFGLVEGRKERMRSREQDRAARETGAFSNRQSEGLRIQAAQDALSDVKDDNRNRRDALDLSINKEITNRIEKLGPAAISELVMQTGSQGSSASDVIQNVGSDFALDKAIELQLGRDSEEGDKIAQELSNLRDGFARSREEMNNQASAAKKNAQANLEAAGVFLKSRGQLLDDMGTDMLRGARQGAIERDLATDPAQRAKLAIREKNRTNMGNAIIADDTETVRLLKEQEEFSGQLIDASAQFAQNIGRAMTDAIAKGEDLGGLLRSAAADFFNTLSQAFMQKAVNSIVGEGSGSGGGFFGSILGFLGRNSGGPVTGGSGARDDVPALLTGGEFVMKKGAVQKYGAGFMAALNQGQIPMMNRGGLFTPGTYGQESIKGKNNLLDFATQGFTTGAFDSVSGGAGFASVALEPQSAALTMFGRRNSPQFAQEQASKKSAFGLYVQQINKEKQMREQEKQANKALLGSVASFALSFGLNSLFSGGGGEAAKKAATGGSIPYAAGVDTVPTMLSGGEFVMNAAATQRIGRGALSSMNSGGGSGDGGAVINKLDELISVSDNQGETIINITVNSDGTSSENGNADEENTNLAGRIRDVVKQVIDDEKRLGGSLRQARA
jgi:TP901 family phage tail tape measure protein